MTEAVITLQHRCGADFGVWLEVLEMQTAQIIHMEKEWIFMAMMTANSAENVGGISSAGRDHLVHTSAEFWYTYSSAPI